MPSVNYDVLIAEYPSEREAIRRLRLLIEKRRGEAFSLPQLIDKVNPESVEALVLVLNELAHRGILRTFYRVYSPTRKGLGIADVAPARISKLPEVVDDPSTGEAVEVTPQNVSTLFRVE